MTRGRGGRLLRAGSLIALVACCAALAGGCGGGSGHSSITLYNGQHTQLTSSLVAAFEKATGITVQIRTNDSAVLADQIVQEGDASPADVYISENSPELMDLQRRGLLTRLPQSILAPGAERRRFADGQLGRHGVAGQQPRLQPCACAAVAATCVASRYGAAAVEGEDRDRSGGFRLPADRRRRDRHARGGGGTRRGSPASSATPGSTRTRRRSSLPSTAATWRLA